MHQTRHVEKKKVKNKTKKLNIGGQPHAKPKRVMCAPLDDFLLQDAYTGSQQHFSILNYWLYVRSQTSSSI